MVNDVRVELSEALVHDMLTDEHGPVGDILRRISRDMEKIAVRKVRVRRGNVWGPGSSAFEEGFTWSSIHQKIGHSKRTGQLYGGLNAAKFPTLWLEHRASQMHRSY